MPGGNYCVRCIAYADCRRTLPTGRLTKTVGHLGRRDLSLSIVAMALAAEGVPSHLPDHVLALLPLPVRIAYSCGGKLVSITSRDWCKECKVCGKIVKVGQIAVCSLKGCYPVCRGCADNCCNQRTPIIDIMDLVEGKSDAVQSVSGMSALANQRACCEGPQ